MRKKKPNGRPPIDRTGVTFGRLTLLARIPYSDRWLCKCSCGKSKAIPVGRLKRGVTKSCGCLRVELSKLRKPPTTKTHGDHPRSGQSDEYTAWCSMKSRCLPSHPSAKNYFDRGIRVCDRWISSFENFLNDMGRKPSKELTLDRTNNDLGYFPENCRWATRKQQANNTRKQKQKSSVEAS
jgi:hypothetical protein